MFNVLAGNLPQINDVWLPCAIQTEPMEAKPLDVYIGKNFQDNSLKLKLK